MADPATIDDLAGRLSSIESGGKYDAQGPVTKKGDRAYGKYQVMGANIPEWTREATGTAADPNTFLADPDLQERTVKHRLSKYYDEYGNARDVASLWHSGVPYDRAAGRRDSLGTRTTDYADRVAGGGAPGGQPLIIELPDGREVDMGVNPSAELQAQVRAKILADFPDLAGGAATKAPTATPAPTPAAAPAPAPQAPLEPSPMSTEPQPLAPSNLDVGAAPTGRTQAPSPAFVDPASEPLHPLTAMGADQSKEQTAANINRGLGFSDTNAVGRYVSGVSKPIADMVTEVGRQLYDDFSSLGSGPQKDRTDWHTWTDGLSRSLLPLQVAGVPGQIVRNIVVDAAKDVLHAPDWAAGLLGFVADIWTGSKIPLPGAMTAHAPPRVRMPLQGTQQTRAVATDTATAAREADEVAMAAERSATTLDEGSLQAQARTEDAQRIADEAAERVRPSTAQRARAEGELTPTGMASTTGSRAVTTGLGQKLEEVVDPVKGIYNHSVTNADTAGKAITPEAEEMLLGQLDALRKHHGNVHDANGVLQSGTLPAKAREVFDRLENALTSTSGEKVSARLIDDFKQQLDDLFPGLTPRNATPMEKQLWQFKWDTRDALRSMFEGDDKLWAEAADALYRDEIIGKGIDTALGPLTRLARKSPSTFVERVMGHGRSDKNAMYAEAVINKLGEKSMGAAAVRDAVMARGLDAATDTGTGALDPKKLLDYVGKFKPGFYDSVVSKEADTLFKVMRKELADVETTADAAKRGAQWMGASQRESGAAATRLGKATREAGAARDVAATAAEKAAKPNKIAQVAGGVLQIALPAAVAATLGPEAGAALGLAMGAGTAAGGAAGLGAAYGLHSFTKYSMAKVLANAPASNALARALVTGATTPAAVPVARELVKRLNEVFGKRSPEEKATEDEARFQRVEAEQARQAEREKARQAERRGRR